jgi:hypothetical protein
MHTMTTFCFSSASKFLIDHIKIVQVQINAWFPSLTPVCDSTNRTSLFNVHAAKHKLPSGLLSSNIRIRCTKKSAQSNFFVRKTKKEVVIHSSMHEGHCDFHYFLCLFILNFMLKLNLKRPTSPPG